jgi:hypothetical protein
MSTSAVIEPPMIPAMPLVDTPLPTTHAVEAVPAEMQVPRGPTARRGNNLAAAVLLLAVEDYRNAGGENHTSARKFLYPQTPAAKEHLAAICGMMNGITIGNLREALDRLRPIWDAERKKG